MDIHSFNHPKQGRSSQQFIAAGDDEGTLHILEAPRNLIRPLKNEGLLVGTFFDREVKRSLFSSERKDFRMQEKSKFDANAIIESTKEKVSKEDVVVIDEESDRMEDEYATMEKNFLEMI